MSKAKPIAAMTQINHCVRVSFSAAMKRVGGTGEYVQRKPGSALRWAHTWKKLAKLSAYFFACFIAAAAFLSLAGAAPGATGVAPSPIAYRCVCVPTYITLFATIGVE